MVDQHVVGAATVRRIEGRRATHGEVVRALDGDATHGLRQERGVFRHVDRRAYRGVDRPSRAGVEALRVDLIERERGVFHDHHVVARGAHGAELGLATLAHADVEASTDVFGDESRFAADREEVARVVRERDAPARSDLAERVAPDGEVGRVDRAVVVRVARREGPRRLPEVGRPHVVVGLLHHAVVVEVGRQLNAARDERRVAAHGDLRSRGVGDRAKRGEHQVARDVQVRDRRSGGGSRKLERRVRRNERGAGFLAKAAHPGQRERTAERREVRVAELHAEPVATAVDRDAPRKAVEQRRVDRERGAINIDPARRQRIGGAPRLAFGQLKAVGVVLAGNRQGVAISRVEPIEQQPATHQRKIGAEHPALFQAEHLQRSLARRLSMRAQEFPEQPAELGVDRQHRPLIRGVTSRRLCVQLAHDRRRTSPHLITFVIVTQGRDVKQTVVR